MDGLGGGGYKLNQVCLKPESQRDGAPIVPHSFGLHRWPQTLEQSSPDAGKSGHRLERIIICPVLVSPELERPPAPTSQPVGEFSLQHASAAQHTCVQHERLTPHRRNTHSKPRRPSFPSHQPTNALAGPVNPSFTRNSISVCRRGRLADSARAASLVPALGSKLCMSCLEHRGQWRVQ